MEEQMRLAQQFEENRPHLKKVAFRILGSASEADDAVQETWLRLSRSDTCAIDNLTGWLTTVVARICLDILRSRKARPEVLLDIDHSRIADTGASDPEREAILADSIGSALLVVLDTLTPAERVAFVLHDMFAVPFDGVGPILGRSPTAARQLASRARRRVQGVVIKRPDDRTLHKGVVDAFFAASREGDFEALLAVLAPDVVLRADSAALLMGASDYFGKHMGEVRGAPAVADTFKGRAQAARPALIDGVAGAVWAVEGRTRVVFAFTITSGKIIQIELIADRERLQRLDIVLLDA